MTQSSPTQLDRVTAAHVLRRVGFGGNAEAVDRAVEVGLEATLVDLETRHETSGGTAANLTSKGGIISLQAQWMTRILEDRAPLLERVTLMWHGHFATSNAKLGDVDLMRAQNELFRSKGLGDFRELFHATAKDPAMLIWLDGNRNIIGAPNENFAREVMELFGLGIQGGYTEEDIQEAARAFSGWSVINKKTFKFIEQNHDSREKTLFGTGGVYSGEDALNRVLAHPACARWIAWRLLHTFVAPEPSDEDVARFAAVLVEEDWHIGRTLGHIFRDPVFLDASSLRSRIAGPIELVAGVALATRAEIPPVKAVRAAGVMGQTLFLPPSVKGWDGGRAWIDPGSWLARHNWISNFALAQGLVTKKAFGEWKPTQAEGRAGAIDHVCHVLMPEGVDAEMRAVLEVAAKTAHSDGHALHKVAALVMTSPEFHLV